IKNINVGNDLIKKGDGEYKVTLSQKNTTVYNPDETSSRQDDDTLKLNARYHYGLNNKLSVGGGISSQEVDGKRHDYLNLGAKGSFEGYYLSGEYLHDTMDGDAVEMLAQTGIGNIDLRFKQSFYNNFIDNNGGHLNLLKSQTEISASGRIKGNDFMPDIPITMGYSETERDNSTYKRIRGRLSAYIKNINLNNSLQWYENDTSSGDTDSFDGNFQATTQIGDFRFRSSLDYDIDPDTAITSVELSSFVNIDNNLSTELLLKKDMETDEDFQGALRLNWNNGKFNVSPQISYNTDGEWTAFIGFSTSLGMEPRSGKVKTSSNRLADSGAVSAKVYHDKNHNLVFDKGDDIIEGALVKASQSNRKIETGENGVAFLTGLQKYKPNDIVLDKDTL
ncbi:MAG: hypothetical protein KAI17_19105, partial [Thiotrichaceae bacterium]|nr:hypothetical protein [Thiotrichaceae bacterium]